MLILLSVNTHDHCLIRAEGLALFVLGEQLHDPPPISDFAQRASLDKVSAPRQQGERKPLGGTNIDYAYVASSRG